MWSPEGYVSLYDITVKANVIASNYHSYLRSAIAADHYVNDVDLEDQEELFDNEYMSPHSDREVDLFEKWIIARTLTQATPRLCSPEGAIVIPSGNLFQSAHPIGEVAWQDYYNSSVIKRNMRYHLGLTYFDLKIFYGIDIETGLIPAFQEIRISDQSITENDLNDLQSMFTIGKIAEPLRKNFAGWSVCFKSKDIDNSVQGVIQIAGLPILTASAIQAEKINNLELLWSEILEVNPHGKTDTWPVLQKKLNYSVRHMKRACKKYDPQNDWLEGRPPR